MKQDLSGLESIFNILGKLAEGVQHSIPKSMQEQFGKEVDLNPTDLPDFIKNIFGDIQQDDSYDKEFEAFMKKNEEEIRKDQERQLLNLPLEVLEAQADLWNTLVQKKKDQETPEFLKELLTEELADVDAAIAKIKDTITDLMLKSADLANKAYSELSVLVLRKKELEEKIAELAAL